MSERRPVGSMLSMSPESHATAYANLTRHPRRATATILAADDANSSAAGGGRDGRDRARRAGGLEGARARDRVAPRLADARARSRRRRVRALWGDRGARAV